MRKTVTVDIPDEPDVEKFVLLDRPEITYVNTACHSRKGVVRIIPKTPKGTKQASQNR